MKFMVITRDPEIEEAARKGFHPSDEMVAFGDWSEALKHIQGVDMVFVDLLATLKEPHKIAGYEEFAEAKMNDPVAKDIPLVLVAAPDDYELDFMTGWPDFVFGHVRRPVTEKIFRRASTWI
jgi:hypothetical protein